MWSFSIWEILQHTYNRTLFFFLICDNTTLEEQLFSDFQNTVVPCYEEAEPTWQQFSTCGKNCCLAWYTGRCDLQSGFEQSYIMSETVGKVACTHFWYLSIDAGSTFKFQPVNIVLTSSNTLNYQNCQNSPDSRQIHVYIKFEVEGYMIRKLSGECTHSTEEISLGTVAVDQNMIWPEAG